jgi:hypothetical protein
MPKSNLSDKEIVKRAQRQQRMYTAGTLVQWQIKPPRGSRAGIGVRSFRGFHQTRWLQNTQNSFPRNSSPTCITSCGPLAEPIRSNWLSQDDRL